jgi:hypothetical protein
MLLEHGHLQNSHAGRLPDTLSRDSGVVSRRAPDVPPFWELEALIEAGCDLSDACLVLAALREARTIGTRSAHMRFGAP